MFSWLVDNATTVYFLLGVVALGLVAGWWMNRRGKYLIALVVPLGLAALVWLLSLLIVTDNVRLERACQEMAQGIRSRNLDQIFKHISKKFNRANHQALDAAGLRDLAQRHLAQREGANVHFSRFSFVDVSRAKGSAQVQFWVHGAGDLEGLPVRCEADFVLEEDAWRMKGFLLFIGNTTNQYPFP
jgi:hypothetical protein